MCYLPINYDHNTFNKWNILERNSFIYNYAYEISFSKFLNVFCGGLRVAAENI